MEAEIMRLYDEEVARHPDGIKVAEAKAAILPTVIDWLEDRPLLASVAAELITDRAVTRIRDTRSRNLARDLEFILDFFANPDEAALIPDTRMAWAVRLGSNDGADKSLRYWRAEDFAYWVQVRIQHARDARQSADDAETVVQRLIDRMHAANALFFGDIDWRQPELGEAS